MNGQPGDHVVEAAVLVLGCSCRMSDVGESEISTSSWRDDGRAVDAARVRSQAQRHPRCPSAVPLTPVNTDKHVPPFRDNQLVSGKEILAAYLRFGPDHRGYGNRRSASNRCPEESRPNGAATHNGIGPD